MTAHQAARVQASRALLLARCKQPRVIRPLSTHEHALMALRFVMASR